MADYKLALKKRELVGKKTRLLREKGLIPSVVFGGKEPIILESEYVSTEKVLKGAGYHSPIDLDMDGKKQMAIVKDVHFDPVTRKIINIEFQAISADEAVVASTPIVIVNFEASEASKTYHFALSQVMEEIEVWESNQCGADLTWQFDGGTLTISGTGEMDETTALLDLR